MLIRRDAFQDWFRIWLQYLADGACILSLLLVENISAPWVALVKFRALLLVSIGSNSSLFAFFTEGNPHPAYY